jgi:hypothetical protein
MIENKIRPFATKKIIEAFGIQEQDLIDFVVDHIHRHGSAESLAKELEMVKLSCSLSDDRPSMTKPKFLSRRCGVCKFPHCFLGHILTFYRLILETESKKRKIPT